MRKTDWLQETLRMRFDEVYGDWTESRLTQEEAARLLGVRARTCRRYIDRSEDKARRRYPIGGRRWMRCCGWWIAIMPGAGVGT